MPMDDIENPWHVGEDGYCGSFNYSDCFHIRMEELAISHGRCLETRYCPDLDHLVLARFEDGSEVEVDTNGEVKYGKYF